MIDNNLQAAPSRRSELFLSGLLGLLLVAGLVGGLYLYQSVRGFVAQSQLPIFPAADSAPPVLPASAAEGPLAPTEGEAPSDTPAPPPTDGDSRPLIAAPQRATAQPVATTERLTVLVMGIDRRKGEEGPWRTDTMILISVDPETESVAMLSMPRDLFVTIPDYGEGEFLDRINKAFFFGDSEEYPGGGPALAMRTIRRNFGIEVDRYLVMDFDGFRRVIDEIGGIEIDVPELLIDNEYPTEDYGTTTVRFEAGPQTMDGERALIYSRTRHSTSDFARAERQQEVILAVRDRVLSLDIIPSLTPTRLARLVTTLDDSIQTDMSLDEVFSLAQVARNVKSRNIERAVVDSTMVTDYITDLGAQVLMPRWNVILPLVEETFDIELRPIAPTPTLLPSPPTAPPTRPPHNNGRGTASQTPTNPQPTATIAPLPIQPTVEPTTVAPFYATIQVLNGTGTSGLEEVLASQLRQGGFSVTGTGVADRADYESTLIIVNNPAAAQTAQLLQGRYQLGAGNIRLGEGYSGSPDILLILGQDMVRQ